MYRIGWVAALLLAGCAQPFPGTGGDVPEVVMKRSTDEFAPPARGYIAVGLRAFVPTAEGGWQETPARCDVAAGAYRAAVMSPARVLMPDLGPDAPPISAECSSGTVRGQAIVAPAYPWPDETKPNAFERITYAGWWRGYQKSGPLRYPDLAVGMR